MLSQIVFLPWSQGRAVPMEECGGLNQETWFPASSYRPLGTEWDQTL